MGAKSNEKLGLGQWSARIHQQNQSSRVQARSNRALIQRREMARAGSWRVGSQPGSPNPAGSLCSHRELLNQVALALWAVTDTSCPGTPSPLHMQTVGLTSGVFKSISIFFNQSYKICHYCHEEGGAGGGGLCILDIKGGYRDFPGGPWLRIAFQCRGHGLGPRSGNQEPTCHAAKKKKKHQASEENS